MLTTSFARATGITVIASAALLVAACTGSRTATESRGAGAPAAATAPVAAPSAAPAGAPAPFVAPAPAPVALANGSQAQSGAGLFAQSCAKCHGAAGQGSADAPALIGARALPTNPPAGRRMRTGAFASAKDIGMFIKDRMPPGSHTPPDQTAAILTFLLQSNGVQTSGTMNPSTAATIPWQR